MFAFEIGQMTQKSNVKISLSPALDEDLANVITQSLKPAARLLRRNLNDESNLSLKYRKSKGTPIQIPLVLVGTRSPDNYFLNSSYYVLSIYELSSLMKTRKQGGIDFTNAQAPLQVQNAGEAIKFHVDPAMLAQLQNAPGFSPVIINIAPLNDLRLFLGITEESPTATSA